MFNVAIIGGGPSGLAAAKAIFSEGLVPTVFEKGSQIGGLWKPNAGTWNKMTTNLSHFTCHFSDFPWPPNTPDFPNQAQVHEYLNHYAEHFSLHQYVRLNADVQKVEKKEDQWVVKWIQPNGIEYSEEFSYVIIAAGVFAKAHIPSIAGMESFNGLSIHSKEYRSPDLFRGKKVVVVGNSYSGTEIAAEVGKEASKVTHLIRKPYWIIPRYLSTGAKPLPLDFVFYQRASLGKSQTPEEKNRAVNGWFSQISNQAKISSDLEVKGDASHPYFVSISDTYLDSVSKGAVCPKNGFVENIEANQLTYNDGTKEEVDAIIWSTGYETDLEFLDSSVKEDISYDPKDHFQPLLLDRCVFPLKTANMAFVGMYRGPYFGVIEMQAIWVAKVFSKAIGFPTQEERLKGVDEEKAIRGKVPRSQFPHPNYMEMMESYAKLNGLALDLDRVQKEDLGLHEKLTKIVPLTPDQYRLNGKEKVAATQEIERVYQRMIG